ncbi:MAG: DUF2252 family protein [Caldilineaceae bacterium]
MLVIRTMDAPDLDRTAAFRTFAQARAAGEVSMLPLALPPEERRLYVRRTLREDHQFRIRNRPEGAQAKFDKLAKSLFVFFRGTALLYYRDYAGTDRALPTVFTIGDVHPENFGVMPNEDGAPIFGVNDFDEAYMAPFSYDVKRGALGFYLVAWEMELAKKQRQKTVAAFVQGYLDGLMAFAKDDREKWHEFRLDNSPGMIRDLLKAAQKPRATFLQKWIDLDNERFVSSEEIVPHSKQIAAFQKVVNTYRKENQIQVHGTAKDFFTVKDVAIKKGSGTASLGLDRYFVLIEGPSANPGDDVILECKQARRSALYGLTPTSGDGEDRTEMGDAEQIVQSQTVHIWWGVIHTMGAPRLMTKISWCVNAAPTKMKLMLMISMLMNWWSMLISVDRCSPRPTPARIRIQESWKAMPRSGFWPPLIPKFFVPTWGGLPIRRQNGSSRILKHLKPTTHLVSLPSTTKRK